LLIRYIDTPGYETVAELSDDSIIITCADDVPDILGELGMNNCNRIIIHERNLHKNFFNLSTRIAGDILQKFSNYRVRLAIVGDFSKYPGKSFNDFIRESNRGNLVFFTGDFGSAFQKLSGM
jgi:Domain of unknown function (DUF4180)